MGNDKKVENNNSLKKSPFALLFIEIRMRNFWFFFSFLLGLIIYGKLYQTFYSGGICLIINLLCAKFKCTLQ